MDAHQGVTRALAAFATAVAVGACPTPSPDDGTAGDDHGGGEEPVTGATSALPDSPLDPIRDHALADLPEGTSVTALIVRADVAYAAAADADAEHLEWHRVGLILAPFGLRLFEHTPRGITREDHGEPATDESVAPIANALVNATPLTADECTTLPASTCEPLSTLDVASELPARPVRRIAIATIAPLPQ